MQIRVMRILFMRLFKRFFQNSTYANFKEFYGYSNASFIYVTMSLIYGTTF